MAAWSTRGALRGVFAGERALQGRLVQQTERRSDVRVTPAWRARSRRRPVAAVRARLLVRSGCGNSVTMPRVLMITPDFPPTPGGIQLVAYELASHFEHSECRVLTLDGD